LSTFSIVPVIFLHAVNMLFIVLVSKAHVCVKHHLKRLLVHLYINSLPVIFVWVAIDGTVWTPTMSKEGMVIVIIENS